MEELNLLVVKAKSDIQERERLIRSHEAFILKCASKSCRRYITRSDDEWSVSIMAFSQAIDGYEITRGSFLSFSALVIKRRLLDYRKSKMKYINEIPVDPTSPDI